MFVFTSGATRVFLFVYVDDIVVTGSYDNML